MKVKIGVNGFGRIGRLLTRAIIERCLGEIVAINDPNMDVDYMVYNFKYDTMHGKWNGDVSKVGDNVLCINGQKILCYREKDPLKIPWNISGVQIVAECSGVILDTESASKHLVNGPSKCVIAAPPKDKTPWFVMGANEDTYKSEMKVASNTTCTANCIAPILKVLNEKFGLVEGLISIVHSTTPNQVSIDGPCKGGRDWRAGRSCSANIIPSFTGIAKAIDNVVPAIKGKISGIVFRCPNLDVSVVDLTCRLEKDATYEEVCKAIKEASEGKYKGIIEYTEDDIVSSDVLHNSHSSVFDAKAGVFLNSRFMKLVAWFDNEWAFSNRMLDLIIHIAKTDKMI